MGDVFIADGLHGRVIEVPLSGSQTTVATGLSEPTGVAVDGAGDVFIADSANDRVVEVPHGGTQFTLVSGLSFPEGVAVDSAGDVFIADTGNDRVLELPKGGTLTPIATGLSRPEGVGVDAAGDVFIADTGNNQILEVQAGATQPTVVTSIANPYAVAVDATGDLFIANGQVTKRTPSGTESTIGFGVSFADSVALDTPGDAFIADSGNDDVLEVAPGVPVNVSSVPTTTSLAVSSTTSLFGESETFTATINVPSGATPASAGSVMFLDGTTPIDTAPVSGGMATFTTSTLALGSHTITAEYSGATGYNASTSRSRSCRSPVLTNPPMWPWITWETCSSPTSRTTRSRRSRPPACRRRSAPG